MSAGYHEVAKRYIIYREERAKERRIADENALLETLEWVKGINVKTVSGQEKPINLDEIRFKLETCCKGLADVSSETLFKEAVKNYFNGITESNFAPLTTTGPVLPWTTVAIARRLSFSR